MIEKKPPPQDEFTQTGGFAKRRDRCDGCRCAPILWRRPPVIAPQRTGPRRVTPAPSPEDSSGLACHEECAYGKSPERLQYENYEHSVDVQLKHSQYQDGSGRQSRQDAEHARRAR
jgi:hypothetical protein